MASTIIVINSKSGANAPIEVNTIVYGLIILLIATTMATPKNAIAIGQYINLVVVVGMMQLPDTMSACIPVGQVVTHLLLSKYFPVGHEVQFVVTP